MGELLVGTSGWEYPEWVGPVYPKGRGGDHLAAYARRFRIVEVNSTFYALPPPSRAESWVRRTPEEFRFSAKFPQEITHERRLVDSDDALRRFHAVLAPLLAAGRFVAALLQLPPSLTFDPTAVRRFYESIPPEVPVAVEFREPSWLAPASFDLLREFRYAYVVVDEPLLPIRLEVTAPFAYVRWHGHGRPVWYDYRYSPAELEAWVPRLAAIAERADRTYGFFNNHFRGDAVQNAEELIERMGLPPPRAAPTLEAAVRRTASPSR